MPKFKIIETVNGELSHEETTEARDIEQAIVKACSMYDNQTITPNDWIRYSQTPWLGDDKIITFADVDFDYDSGDGGFTEYTLTVEPIE